MDIDDIGYPQSFFVSVLKALHIRRKLRSIPRLFKPSIKKIPNIDKLVW